MADVPKMTRKSKYLLMNEAKKLAWEVGTADPWPISRMPESYGGIKGARYMQALSNVLSRGIDRRDSRLSFFVKLELVKQKKARFVPRPIQFRRAEYCVAYAQYYKPIEGLIYEFEGDGYSFPEGRLFAKNLNSVQRGELIYQKWCNIDDPFAACLDFSRYDEHISLDHLKAAHRFKTMVIGDREFSRLDTWQYNNRGRSQAGVYFSHEGGRCSGDMNTAGDNNALTLLMLNIAAREVGLKCNFLIDGDDSIIFCSRRDWALKGDRFMQALVNLGMTVKVEGYATIMEHIDFCQCRPVLVGGSYRMVRNPGKVVSKMGFTTKPYTLDMYASYIQQLGYAEGLINLGVPVLQSFAYMCARVKAKHNIKWDEREDHVYYLRRELGSQWRDKIGKLPAPSEISAETRASFAAAFDFPYPQQLFWEQVFDAEDVQPVDIVALFPTTTIIDWPEDLVPDGVDVRAPWVCLPKENKRSMLNVIHVKEVADRLIRLVKRLLIKVGVRSPSRKAFAQ